MTVTIITIWNKIYNFLLSCTLSWKILKSKAHSEISEWGPWYGVICASLWITWFQKLKKASFRYCLTFWWSKVDSDVLSRSQKLILTFSDIYQSGNLKACETNTVNLSLNWNYMVFGLYVIKSLTLWCFQSSPRTWV